MSVSYSLVHLTDLNCPPPALIRTAVKAGYECVSLRSIPMGLPGETKHDLVSDKAMLRETRQAMKETGVLINDIENARIFDGVEIAQYEPAMAAAAELGVRHVLCNIWSEDRSFQKERFQELCELAAEYGQQVNLEFVTFASVRDLKQSQELLLSVPCKNVGIVVDSLHHHRSRVNTADLGRLPVSWFPFVHLCDAPAQIPTLEQDMIHTARAERLYPGEGATDVKGIVEQLPQAVRGLEVPHSKRLQELGLEEHARKALRYAKTCLGE